MTPRLARVLVAACVIVGFVAVIVARRSSPEDIAPETVIAAEVDLPVLAATAPAVRASGWINTAPLGPADLQGKVVLYDFWTFGCFNCKNTLSYVQAWHARYAADGLVVLSIHTPEFDYERDPAAVAEFVEEHGLTYPVALDPDKLTWRAFGNRFWPRFYLHDDAGRLRYDHVGEGRYAATEDAIRVLLGVDPGSPRASVAP